MFDFVKRTNQLMFGAAKESLTDYTRDISELGNAASQVRDKLSSGTKTARDTMSSFKSTGVVSAVSNWFYGKEFELGDADEMLFDNDEFRSGNPEWDNNDDEEADSSVLTASSMKDLVKGQVSSMYKIGSKQTEASVANTAEIVTNISKSSAEMVAAINNVNSSLITISGKLDGLVELLKPAERGSKSTAQNGWYDSNGGYTIRSLMEGIKNPNNFSGSLGMLGMAASMLSDPNMRKMVMTPENLVSMFIMDPLMNHEFKALGGRSVDSYGKQFQSFTHNLIEDAIQTLMDKTPIGDMMGREKYRGNLGRVENQYTKDAAVFDKATRHTIISIIPEYLKKMTEAMTGQKWNINDQGYLTTKAQANPYSRIGNVLNNASLDYDQYRKLEENIVENPGLNIDYSDFDNAQKAWIWVVVHDVIYSENRKNITSKTITNMLSSPKFEMYLDRAVQAFNAFSGGRKSKKARKILKDVFLMICGDPQSASALSRAGNKYITEIEQEAQNISESNPNAGQFVNQSSLNWDTSIGNVLSDYKRIKEENDRARYESRMEHDLRDKYGRGKWNDTKVMAELNRLMNEYDKAHPSSDKEEEVTSRIGVGGTSSGFGSFVKEMNKYSKSIYDILNKGVVNVRIVSGNVPSNTSRGKRVRKLRVKHPSSDGSSDDSSDGEPAEESAYDTSYVTPTSTSGWLDDTIEGIKTEGFVNTVRGRISEGVSAVGTYYTNTKNTLKMESISNKVNAENSTVSDMDKQRVQMVNTALQTAMQDGDGVEDKSKIRSMISTIQDPKLKQEMTKVADSVLTKESSKDGEPKSNSLFGRLLTGLGSKIKSAFSFVLKPIGFLLKGIGKGLKAYWNWTKSVWASGLEDGKRGINNIKSGISDFRELSAQNKARIQAQKQQQLRAKQRASIQMDDISDIQRADTGTLSVDNLGGNEANTVGKTKEVASKIADSKTGRTTRGFGSDFAAGFNEARSEKKLAKLDKSTPDTIADKESRTIREKLEEFMNKFFNGDNKFAKDLKDLIVKDTKAVEDLSPKTKTNTTNLTNNKNQYGQMEDLYASVGSSTSTMESLTTESSSNLGSASSNTNTVKMPDISDGTKSKGKALGKIFAGTMSIASMVMKFVGPVIAGMAGIQAITELLQKALKDILAPLGKLFTKLFKVLQPVVELLKDALEPFMETITDVLVDIITPLGPIVESIFECLSPILDIVTVLLDAIMVPLMGIFNTIIVPSLEIITGSVKAIVGAVMTGFGAVEVILGSILSGLGTVVKWQTFGLGMAAGDSLKNKGKEMIEQGASLFEKGNGLFLEGLSESFGGIVHLMKPSGDINEEEPEQTIEIQSYQAKDSDVTPGSAMDGLLGNGDVVNNYYYQNMYGSGNSTYNQNSYHNGMNMSQHGCGPIALADRANRMGGGINPYSLTQAMMANGNYSANAGTSVAGMISTGRALGMNLVPGGVTADSLRGASPRNPITVIGSGIGFGTRNGANHYVNVVGTDSAGGAYVSNPMTGRVGRVRTNELVANSALGLYGSGDEVSYSDVFGDEVASAFGELSNVWTNISNIFNFKDNETTAEKTKKALEKENTKRRIENIKSKYSDEEWQKKYDEISKDNPKEDKESEADYRFRINEAVANELAQDYNENSASSSTIGFLDENGEFRTNMSYFVSTIKNILDTESETPAVGSSFGGSGGFYSASGNVRLATDAYTPEFTDTNMEESVNGHYIHSPIHEFFAKMGGLSWAESNNNWYKYYSDPHSKDGEGRYGDSHQGIDINLGGGVRGVTPIYATTDGTLVIHQPEALAQGGGNYVEWIDNDGMHHRIMHLDHFSEEMERMRPGDSVIGGKTLLGYYGSTGYSTGDHIHYDISPNGYMSSEWYNPLTYFNFKPSATDGDSSYIEGNTLDEQMWQWLRFKGMKLPESSVAGIMGVWKAEGVQPRMIEGAYSEPETSLAESIYDAIVGDPDNNTAGLQKLWDYTPTHAAGKNGGYLPNYMYNGHPWAGLGLAQWTAGRTYKLLKHAWDHGQRKWYELLPQLQYFEEELKTTHTKAGNELAAGEGHTPEEMAQMFWRDFEGYTWGQQADYDKRRNNARAVYDRFKGTTEINSTNFGKINSPGDEYYAGYSDKVPGGGSQSSTNVEYTGNGDTSQGGNIPGYNSTSVAYNNYMYAHDHAGNDRTSKNSSWRNYVDKRKARFNTYAAALGNTKQWYFNGNDPKNNIPYLTTTDQIGDYWLGKGKFDKSSQLVNSTNRYTALFENGRLGSYPTKLLNALANDNIGIWNAWGNDVSEARKYFKLAHANDTTSVPGIDSGDQWVLGADILDTIIGTSAPRVVTSSGGIDNPNATKPSNTAKKFSSSLTNLSLSSDLRIPNIWGKEADGRVRSAINGLVLPVRGSGDEIANDIIDIPPIDYSKIPSDDWTDTLWNTISNQQASQYTETSNTEANDRIDKILANEFKTSDKRTHELLEKIYAYLEEKESGNPKPTSGSGGDSTPQGSQDMFEDKIPNSVYRLARG